LLSEFCKYGLQRAWSYYPAHLPKGALSPEIRNGRIDRKLALPLEDLYPDGQAAGQVGQEVYGAGSAFAFVTNNFHHVAGAPFLLYCEYPVADFVVQQGRGSLTVCGDGSRTCELAFLSLNGRPVSVPETVVDGRAEKFQESMSVPGGAMVEFTWKV